MATRSGSSAWAVADTHLLGRIAITLAAALGAAVVAAILITVADLYVTGHGGATLSGPWLEWPALGVHLSPADVLMLSASAVVGVVTWRRSGRRTA
jgi:hypothetical protein